MLLSRPNCNRDRNGQHRKTRDGKTGNGEHKIPYESVEDTEMLPSQRESPLEPEQGEKKGSQQGVADVIHQGNFGHWIGILENAAGGTAAATVMLDQSRRSLSVEAAVSAAFNESAATLSSIATQLQRTASGLLIWFFDQDNRCAGEKS